MSVTAPQGFRAAGVSAGLKDSGGLDLALIVNDGPSRAAAAVFTANRAQANPILWSKEVASSQRASALVLNSGGANCFTGDVGFETTRLTAESVASGLGLSIDEVLVCSTGLIGEQLPREKMHDGVAAAIGTLASDEAAGDRAAEAIMTTDTRAKTAEHRGEGWSIGAMAKGAGMLAPGLATMLVAITTDVDLSADALDEALREATRVSFDRLDSDGCMSTNDQVTLLSSGAAPTSPGAAEFTAALTAVCLDLARQLQQDAEGAAHDVDITVTGAVSEDDAVTVARSVARSNLFKTAIFGNDPNWGRVLAAIGTTDARFDPYRVDVSMNGVRVCHAGEPDRPRDEVDLTGRSAAVLIELHEGDAGVTLMTNDLTHDYVHENSAYSS